jgi:DnaJ-class molecular chaperone
MEDEQARDAGANRNGEEPAPIQQDKNKIYEAFGVPANATKADIKRRWRTISLQSHPDKGGSTENYQWMTTIYEILRDESLRGLYNTQGWDAVQEERAERAARRLQEDEEAEQEAREKDKRPFDYFGPRGPGNHKG